MIFKLAPNRHSLVTFLTQFGTYDDGGTTRGSALKKRAVANSTFECDEEYTGGKFAKVSGTYSTGAVTITVTGAGTSSAYVFTVGDVIFNARTRERMLVATVASATTITVAATGRSLGTTAAAAGQDGDTLLRIGNANEEHAGLRNVNTTQTTQVTNYTQIFRTSIAISGTLNETRLYGGDEIKRLRGQQGTKHAMEIEDAFWFGEAANGTGANSKPQRYTGGILEHIESSNAYIQDQDGSLTPPDMAYFVREGMTYGSNTKKLFCGNNILNAIDEMSRGQLQTTMDETTYGIGVRKWHSTAGDIDLIVNAELFNNDFAGYGFLLDMNSYDYVYMRNRDTKLRLDVGVKGDDGMTDEYITECGLERKLAPQNALIKNVTD